MCGKLKLAKRSMKSLSNPQKRKRLKNEEPIDIFFYFKEMNIFEEVYMNGNLDFSKYSDLDKIKFCQYV